MKRIISALLFASVLLSLLIVPVSAEEEPKYYQVKVFPDTETAYFENIDFMVMGEQCYVNAEQFAFYLGYTYNQSRDNCCFYRDQMNMAYLFSFDSGKVDVYLDGTMVNYTAPFAAEYLDGVTWVPFNYTAALLGASCFLSGEGPVIIPAPMSVLEVICTVKESLGDYGFNWIDEVGYDNFRVLLNSGVCTIVGFIDGLFDGSFWSEIGFDLNAGIYNDNVVRQIADLFVTPSAEELEAYAKLTAAEESLSADVSKLSTAKDVVSAYKSAGDATKAASILSYVATDVLDDKLGQLADRCDELMGLATKDASLVPEFNRVSKKMDTIFDLQTATGKAGDGLKAINSKMDIIEVDGVSFVDVAAFTVNVYGYMDKMSARDSGSIDALKKYANNSDLGLSYPLAEYASKLKVNSEWYDAIAEYLEREGGTIVMDKLPLANIIGGPGAVLVLGWNVAKSFVPYLKDSLTSMEHFKFAEYAIDYQNDCGQMVSDLVAECFSANGIKESSLKDLSDSMYAYFKFSSVARSCAEVSLLSVDIDQSLKDKIINIMHMRNTEIAEYMVVLAQADDNNESLVYGFLPSDSRNYRMSSSPEAGTCEYIISVGKQIEASSQTTAPDDTIDLRGAITEEEAIDVLVDTIGGAFAFLLDGGTVESLLDFSVIGTYRVIMPNFGYCDTYVIKGMEEAVSDTGYFFVSLDGKHVWMGTPVGDGQYEVVHQVDLKNFSLMDLVNLLMEYV